MIQLSSQHIAWLADILKINPAVLSGDGGGKPKAAAGGGQVSAGDLVGATAGGAVGATQRSPASPQSPAKQPSANQSAGNPPGSDDDAPRLSPEAARQKEILEEFTDPKRMPLGQSDDPADEPADLDLNEPNRIPELDQGPEPVERLIRMKDIQNTQNSISPKMSDGQKLDNVSDTMATEGWDPSQPNPDMVQNADGRTAKTLDHRRLVAADKAGIEEVPATVHSPDEPLDEDMAERFALDKDGARNLNKQLADSETQGPAYNKGDLPETWGDAAKYRAANQRDRPAYEGDEVHEFPPDGDARPPYLKADRPAVEKPAKPSLAQRADDAMREFQEQQPAARDVVAEFDHAEAAREADLDPANAPPSDPAPAPSEPTPAAASSEPAPVSAAEPPAGGSSTASAAGDAEAASGGVEAGMGGAVGAGLLGGGIAGGAALADDWGKVKSGQMSVGQAAVDVGGKTALGGGLTVAGTKVANAVVGGSSAEAAAAGAGVDAAAAAGGADAMAGAAGAEAGAAAGAATVASVALKGGVIGGVVSGGMALFDDVGKVKSGQMTAGDATVDVGAKTAVGVGAGLAGAAAGAEIGAAVGTAIPIPIVGTAVGLVAGAVVGGAVGYIGNALTNTETGKAILGAAGHAVDGAIDGVEAAGHAIAGAATSAVSGAESLASSAVSGAESLASSAVSGAASLAGSAVSGAESLVSGAGSAVSGAPSSLLGGLVSAVTGDDD